MYFCAGGRFRLQFEDQVLEDLWNIVQALKSALTGVAADLSMTVLKSLLLVSRTNVFSLHEDHESRLRVMELREEEQRKQVQVVVRQYTGQFHK